MMSAKFWKHSNQVRYLDGSKLDLGNSRGYFGNFIKLLLWVQKLGLVIPTTFMFGPYSFEIPKTYI